MFRLFSKGNDQTHHLHISDAPHGRFNWQIAHTPKVQPADHEHVDALSSGPGWATREEAKAAAETFLHAIGARYEWAD